MEVTLKTDIFEDMVELTGCNYISDLPHRRKRVLEELNRNFLSLGITLLFHIHKGIIGCRQALDFLAFRYFL
jgi:hypothetical protein